MKKEVKFLTENSQDKEKALSFKDKILSELAAANGTQNHSAQQEAQPLLDKEMELAESLESLVSAVEKSHEVLEKETSVEEESVKLPIENKSQQITHGNADAKIRHQSYGRHRLNEGRSAQSVGVADLHRVGILIKDQSRNKHHGHLNHGGVFREEADQRRAEEVKHETGYDRNGQQDVATGARRALQLGPILHTLKRRHSN